MTLLNETDASYDIAFVMMKDRGGRMTMNIIIVDKFDTRRTYPEYSYITNILNI